MADARSGTGHTVHSLDDVSRFLRAGVADEDSRQLRESVTSLAKQVDEAVSCRRSPGSSAGKTEPADEAAITRCASTLAQSVREHQRFLTGLGSAWHALYEMGSYQMALREMGRAAEAWHAALVQRSPAEGGAYSRLELLAWRTLGEGLLLIEMYEQNATLTSEPTGTDAALAPTRAGWLMRAWRRVRTRF